MNDQPTNAPLSVQAHAEGMAEYFREGERRARGLPNRGPIKLDASGRLTADILEAYNTYGFYVFEQVVDPQELAELREDVDRVLAAAPAEPDGTVTATGAPAIGLDRKKFPFRYAQPLSDPVGGTDKNNGRHPVKVLEPLPDEGAPAWTINLIDGNLHMMDSCLRLYGHPKLMAAAASVLGDDFVPYNEVTFVKEPKLGPAVAWHQDGTTHWDAADWDRNAHGFNFMTQLYPSTPANCVWVIPGSHAQGKVDIKKLADQAGSERIEGAVPLVCNAGDVFMTNRQIVHGSFANSSPDRRITINAGFFPRKRVLDVTATRLTGEVQTYDAVRIEKRSRIIALAIDARSQHFPDESRFAYAPFAGKEADLRWSETARETILKDYNQLDCFI